MKNETNITEVLERFKGYEVVEKLIWLFAIFFNDCSPIKIDQH